MATVHHMNSSLAEPAAMPPPGVVANFQNPPSQVPLATVLYAVTVTIMTLALALRLFTRWYIIKKYVIEDFLVLLAWLLMIAYGVCSHELGKIGFTVHIWDETKLTYVRGKELITIISIIYNFMIIFLKAAILTQFIRLFAPNRINKIMFYTCWALILINVAVFVIDSILSLVRCSPVQRNWNPYISGHCRFTEFSFRMSTPAVNVGTDAIILVLPLPYIFKLRVDRKKKLLVAGLFAVGAFAVAASTVRLYFTYIVLTGPDPTWNYGYQGMATWFEVSMGSLVVCLPMAPRLVQFLQEKFPTLRSSQRSEAMPGMDAQQMPQSVKDYGPQMVAVVNVRTDSSFRQYLGANQLSLFSDDEHEPRDEEEGGVGRRTESTDHHHNESEA